MCEFNDGNPHTLEWKAIFPISLRLPYLFERFHHSLWRFGSMEPIIHAGIVSVTFFNQDRECPLGLISDGKAQSTIPKNRFPVSILLFLHHDEIALGIGLKPSWPYPCDAVSCPCPASNLARPNLRLPIQEQKKWLWCHAGANGSVSCIVLDPLSYLSHCCLLA